MANEKRSIDAAPLVAKFENAANFYIGPAAAAFHEALEAVQTVPTVDAVEVVHGQWKDMFGGKYVNPRFRCSVCNQKALFKFEPDLLQNYKAVHALTPYCPNCGAKMDGRGNG